MTTDINSDYEPPASPNREPGLDEQNRVDVLCTSTCNTAQKKIVSFAEGPNLVSDVIEPVDPWQNREKLSPYELVGAYKFSCDACGIQPLYSVICQLELIDLKKSLGRRAVFNLKGCQLDLKHIDCLEEVFKRVQFEYLNLTNTNLDDESLMAICDIISYYDSCTELSLARNPAIDTHVLGNVAQLFGKLSNLKWLDLGGIQLTPSCTRILSNVLRSHLTRSNSHKSKIFKFTHPELTASDIPGILNNDVKTFLSIDHSSGTQLKPDLFTSNSPQRGLYLGNTSLNGNALCFLVPGVRLGFVTDLRLPDNRLSPADARLLIPLLRYSIYLKYLDLSKNCLGDEGCFIIANALATPSYPVNTTCSTTRFGLRLLDLSNNHLSFESMVGLNMALTKMSELRTLILASNPNLKCDGLNNLTSGLLKSYKLRRLDLSDCNLSARSMITLTEILVTLTNTVNTTKFIIIKLHHNTFDLASLISLVYCLKCLHNSVYMLGLDELFAHFLDLFKQAETGQFKLCDETPIDLSLKELFLESLQLYENYTQKIRALRNAQHQCKHISGRYSLCFDNYNQLTSDPRYLWGDSSSDEDSGSPIECISSVDNKMANEPLVSKKDKNSSYETSSQLKLDDTMGQSHPTCNKNLEEYSHITYL